MPVCDLPSLFGGPKQVDHKLPFLVHKPGEARTLIFKLRPCAVRSDLKNKHEISRKCLIFKIRSYSARSELKIRVLASLGKRFFFFFCSSQGVGRSHG